MRTMDHQEFERLVGGFRSPRFITLITRTQVKNDVYKLAMVNGIINFGYKSCLSRFHGCDMSIGIRAWGNRDKAFVSYEGKRYLTLLVRKVLGYRFEDSSGGVITGVKERVCKDRGIKVRDYNLYSIQGFIWRREQINLAP